MDNIQDLLKKQVELSKQIAAAYTADAMRKAAIKGVFGEADRKKHRAAGFMNALGQMKEDKITSALTAAGWTLITGDIATGKSTWVKKGSSRKLMIDGPNFKIINGTDIVAGPLPVNDLPAYVEKDVNPGPKTQSAGKL